MESETNRPKKHAEMTFTEKVAVASNASISSVKKVLSGKGSNKRSDATELGSRIWVAATLLDEGINTLLASVKQAVNF